MDNVDSFPAKCKSFYKKIYNILTFLMHNLTYYATHLNTQRFVWVNIFKNICWSNESVFRDHPK